MKAKRIICLALAALMLLSLCACSNKHKTDEQGNKIWYVGGGNALNKTEAEPLFDGIEDKIEPEKIYKSINYTAEMLYGAYRLNNADKDIKTVRKEIPFEKVDFLENSFEITALPTAVYLGKENICSSATHFNYGDFRQLEGVELAVIEFPTSDDVGQVICSYEVNGNKITFTELHQTSKSGEAFAYEIGKAIFEYEFSITGPYLTLTKGNNSLKLISYCFSDDIIKEHDLWLDGYSIIDTPLIDELDYFCASKAINYAIKRDGSYYNVSAFKISDNGIITVYLSSNDPETKAEQTFIEQYAYIVKSSADTFRTHFSVILLDGNKEYYYTDSITEREARILSESGSDVDGLTEDEIKEIAEKKSDLFDDLYKEFEANDINVSINRVTGEISMDASVLFSGDSDVVTAEGKALLDKFIKVYSSIIYNEKYDGFISKTRIEGHTAPMSGSTYESGLPLSEKRAKNVMNYCLASTSAGDTSKLKSSLEAVGLSNSKPVYDSNGEIDTAACRRVSFRFIVNIEK